MPDDPKFSKEVKVDKPMSHETYEAQIQDKALDAFKDAKKDQADRDKEEKAKQEQREKFAESKKTDQPKLEYNMKGSIGSAVKAKVAEENAIRRSKALAAEQKGRATEQQAQRYRSGAIEDAKNGKDPTNKGRTASSLIGQADKSAQQASLMKRADNLKFAMDTKDMAKSKDEFEK